MVVSVAVAVGGYNWCFVVGGDVGVCVVSVCVGGWVQAGGWVGGWVVGLVCVCVRVCV